MPPRGSRPEKSVSESAEGGRHETRAHSHSEQGEGQPSQRLSLTSVLPATRLAAEPTLIAWHVLEPMHMPPSIIQQARSREQGAWRHLRRRNVVWPIFLIAPVAARLAALCLY